MPDSLSFAPRAIQLPAVLQVDDQAPFFGTVVSLSDQGVCFDTQGRTPPPQTVGSMARLDYDVLGSHHACRALVINVQGERILVSLRDAPATVVTALHTARQQQGAHLAASLSTLRMREACHTRFMSNMAPVVNRFYQLLATDAGPGDGTDIRGSLSPLLAPLRPALIRRFTQTYPMYPELQAGYSSPTGKGDGLQLVDMDQVDDWIRRSGLAHQISEALQPLPRELAAQYGRLLGNGEQPAVLPYLPEGVLDVFAKQLAPLALDVAQRTACYELMGRALQQEAVPLYQGLLQMIGDAAPEAGPAPAEVNDLAQWLTLSSRGRDGGSGDAGTAAIADISELAALVARLTENLDELRRQPPHVAPTGGLDFAAPALIPGMLAKDRIMGRFLPAGFASTAGTATLDGAAIENLYAQFLQPPPIDPGPEKIGPASQVRALMLLAQGLLLEYSLNGLTYQARPDHPAWALINALDALHHGADDHGQFLDPALFQATNLAMQWLLGQEDSDAALEQVNALLTKINTQLADEQLARRTAHLRALGEAEPVPAPIASRWCVVKQDDEAIPYEILGRFGAEWVLLNRSATRMLEIPAERFVEELDHGQIEEANSFDSPFLERIASATLTASLDAVHTFTWQDPGSGCLKRSALMDELERRLDNPLTEPPAFCALIEIPAMRPGLSSLPADELAVMQRRTGEILHDFMRAGEQCGRLSDVSFLLIFPSQAPTELAARLTAFRDDVERLHPEWKMFGAAVPLIDETGSLSPSDVLRRANVACAPLRQEGGFDLSCLDDVPPPSNRIEPLPFDSLFLRCQRIASCQDGSPSHYEILLGIADGLQPSHTTQSFVVMAEQTGRSQDLDAWVLKTALEWMERQAGELDRLSGLSINLSGNSLVDSRHVDSMVDLLAQYPQLAGKIILEVTETAAISCLDLAGRSLRKLRRLGCRVALDDFGSGYSSYGYLRSLPLDYLKIDGIYIRNILNDKTDQALTASMVDVAHALGLKVIAEYVDSEETYAWLKNLGVDYVQGYWVHEPQPLDTLSLH